ncbi:MAG: methyl-accepting chemotaxis protein [Nitrospirota bacterium]|nr:methyl-accepting chemotaxis protein [Nitrospirota bacterium]MDH4361065.1 methyl-accepting chemotaxis protein [Nitrospirota bacterium]MDH5296382.1 methyl-accepting chemotaxis protein [Nitrospirota bacterium]MDH5573935.1 methyl-accepting chemotaxis protein [Nitrospirota bacterium]
MWHLRIGPKFVLFLGTLAAGLIVCGLWVMYQQEEGRLRTLLEEEGKIIQVQIEVTRAYIAKNYVGKLKKSSMGSHLHVSRDHEQDPDAIPFPATATQEIGKELGGLGVYQARLVSDQPMNPANAPRDTFEKKAIELIKNGVESVSEIQTINGVPTFRRASADVASVDACVSCHVGKNLGEVIGLLSLSIPMTHAKEAMASSVLHSGMWMIGIILICLGAVYWLVHVLVLKPLHGLTAISRDIAQGEGDLTKRVPVGNGSDEIVELSRYLNSFVGRMQSVLLLVNDATNRLASSTVQLSTTADGVVRVAEGQDARVIQSASAVEEMTMTAGEVARSSTEAAQIARETAETARSGQEVMTQTVIGMQEVSQAVVNAATIITTLGRSSDQIGEIVRVIEDIADQTNLLALNAAIEAARAGEQGRGFAVVADEVRKLAERTTKATKEIGDMIRQIQQDTRSAVSSMDQGTNRVGQGVELANKTGEALSKIHSMITATAGMIQEIANATEEQSTATRQIANDLESMTQTTRQTTSGISKSAKACHDLSLLVGDLQKLVRSFKV